MSTFTSRLAASVLDGLRQAAVALLRWAAAVLRGAASIGLAALFIMAVRSLAGWMDYGGYASSESVAILAGTFFIGLTILWRKIGDADEPKRARPVTAPQKHTADCALRLGQLGILIIIETGVVNLLIWHVALVAGYAIGTALLVVGWRWHQRANNAAAT